MSTVATAIAQNDSAIVVGIARYPQFSFDGNSANNLQGPVNDANEMAHWLTATAQANVTLITSNGDGQSNWSVQDLRPNPQDISERFQSYVRLGMGLPSRRVGRRLYVYMAGHGFMPEPRHLALVTADALSDEILPNVQATSWIDWFADQLYFDEFVLWMDCCATRTFVYSGGKPLLKKAAARQDGRGKVFMGWAAGPSRAAFEGPLGVNGQVRGLFTDRLLRGLNGAAADANGIVSTSSLVAYFKNSNGLVGTLAQSSSNLVSTPTFVEQDELVLANVGSNLKEYSLKFLLADGATVLIQTGNGTFATVTVLNGTAKASLPIGLYKAECGGFSRMFEIASGTPDEVSLA
jgi:hypothetical protein